MYYQKWPEEGTLYDNMNTSLQKIREMVDNEKGVVHTYVIKTIMKKPRDLLNIFFQDGCTPNFEGGLLTYTACRLDLQARSLKEDWIGQWIAGFTSKPRHGEYYLAFLMKVSKAFDAFEDIWYNLDSSVRSVKNARNNPLGDLYEPKSKEIDNKWNPENYYPPNNRHSHIKDDRWKKDINYFHKAWKRRACQLVGDLNNSYLWNEPSIKRCNPFSSPRSGKRYSDLKDLFQDLCSS